MHHLKPHKNTNQINSRALHNTSLLENQHLLFRARTSPFANDDNKKNLHTDSTLCCFTKSAFFFSLATLFVGIRSRLSLTVLFCTYSIPRITFTSSDFESVVPAIIFVCICLLVNNNHAPLLSCKYLQNRKCIPYARILRRRSRNVSIKRRVAYSFFSLQKLQKKLFVVVLSLTAEN